MEKLILTSLIISLCTVGIYAGTWNKMILHIPATRIKRKLPVWLYKPLCGCLICMSSVYGCLFWFIFRTFTILYLPVVILTVAGINTLITAIISNIIPDEEV
ncbi:MAG: hypothetical protein FWF53_06960 [Candidatus Azobacteroides sp.]|nr:hypothetical protein [Candidatus Azobacteroides sp.]